MEWIIFLAGFALGCVVGGIVTLLHTLGALKETLEDYEIRRRDRS